MRIKELVREGADKTQSVSVRLNENLRSECELRSWFEKGRTRRGGKNFKFIARISLFHSLLYMKEDKVKECIILMFTESGLSKALILWNFGEMSASLDKA